MHIYTHKVAYYETDRMGITHHSNYVRWMEEARVEFLREIGWGYAEIEKLHVVSPVVSVECTYKKPTTFDDLVTIETRFLGFERARSRFGYAMYKTLENQERLLVFEGSSTHCFLNPQGRPMRLEKELPEFWQALINSMDNPESEH